MKACQETNNQFRAIFLNHIKTIIFSGFVYLLISVSLKLQKSVFFSLSHLDEIECGDDPLIEDLAATPTASVLGTGCRGRVTGDSDSFVTPPLTPSDKIICVPGGMGVPGGGEPV